MPSVRVGWPFAKLETRPLADGLCGEPSLMLDYLCEWSEEVSDNAIEVYAHRLHRELAAAGVEIVTTRGLGYRIQRAGSA